jgi:tryptophan synthase alpha chain
MTRLDQTFQKLRLAGKKALITFTMAGDPNAQTSLSLLYDIVESGADIIEIGAPFSDPMADGPAVQAAGLRALTAGMTLNGVFEIVQQFRSKNSDTPIVLMGYSNPILKFGDDKFLNKCKDVGVDGLIIVDMPPEETGSFYAKAQQNNVAIIRLIAPTSDQKRLPTILKDASGFLYYVSITGVTGTKTADADAVKKHIELIRTLTDLPIVAGFGIKTPEDAARFAAFADGVVVGSAIVQNIEQNQDSSALSGIISAQVKALKNAV